MFSFLVINKLFPVKKKIKFNVLPPPLNDSIKHIYENDKMLIIIKDSTEFLSVIDQTEFSKNYKDISVDIDSSYQTKISDDIYQFKNLNSHKLNLNLVHKNFDFRFSSKKKKPNENLAFCGQLGLSNIKLDDSKRYGVFSISYTCCYINKCSAGYRIYIVKEKGSWKIDKIIPTWIT